MPPLKDVLGLTTAIEWYEEEAWELNRLGRTSLDTSCSPLVLLTGSC